MQDYASGWRSRRKKAGISLEALSKKSSRSTNIISNIERGNIQNPGIRTVMDIENALTELESEKKEAACVCNK